MLRPEKDCRLHLLLGKPWKEALGSLEREGVSDFLWYWDGALDTGDVLLTALDSRPRMFAVIERAAKPGSTVSWSVRSGSEPRNALLLRENRSCLGKGNHSGLSASRHGFGRRR